MARGRNNRDRGFTAEREIVNKFQECGYEARRMWGSDGRSSGFSKEVDVIINERFKIQSKRQKKLPQYLYPNELKNRNNYDALVLRQDGDTNGHLIVMNLEYFIRNFYEAEE